MTEKVKERLNHRKRQVRVLLVYLRMEVEIWLFVSQRMSITNINIIMYDCFPRIYFLLYPF